MHGWMSLAGAVLPAAVFASAQEAGSTPEQLEYARRYPRAFQVQEVVIERLGPTLQLTDVPPAPPTASPRGDLVVIDQIVNIAQNVWEIVKANEPVVHLVKPYAAAVPRGVTQWEQLVGWRPPEATRYRVRAVNKLGRNVVSFEYMVVRTFNGSYVGQDGIRRGRYLTGVTVEPKALDVSWGYAFDMEVRVPSVINAGQSKEDPIAGMTVNLEWRIATPLQKSYGTGVYYVQGDGLYKEVGGPFRREYADAVKARLERARWLAVPGWQNLLR